MKVMPERPEIETTARLLGGHRGGRQVSGLGVKGPRSLGRQEEAEVGEDVRGEGTGGVTRRARMVVVEL